MADKSLAIDIKNVTEDHHGEAIPVSFANRDGAVVLPL